MQGMSLRLWERFDFGSTFKPVRLWQRGVKRRTLTAAPSGPADAPQDGPSWAKCAFWVHISLNNDLANIKLTLQRVLNFESSQKAQKYIAGEYFEAGALPYDEEKDAYTVQDVQYCIDMAEGTGEEGARCKYNDDGELVPDDDTEVFVTEL